MVVDSFATLFALDTLNKVYVKDGPFISYYKSGRVQEKGQYKKTKLTGDILLYDTNGVLVSNKYYEKGKKTKRAVYYDFQNRPIRYECWWQGLMIDVSVNLNAKWPDCSFPFVGRDKKTFRVDTIYNKSPRFISVVRGVKNGRSDGKVYYYYPNQNLKGKAFFNQSKLEGKAFTYYNSGALESIYFYIKGKKNGVASLFSEKGDLEKRECWSKGEFIDSTKTDKPNTIFCDEEE